MYGRGGDHDTAPKHKGTYNQSDARRTGLPACELISSNEAAEYIEEKAPYGRVSDIWSWSRR